MSSQLHAPAPAADTAQGLDANGRWHGPPQPGSREAEEAQARRNHFIATHGHPPAAPVPGEPSSDEQAAAVRRELANAGEVDAVRASLFAYMLHPPDQARGPGDDEYYCRIGGQPEICRQAPAAAPPPGPGLLERIERGYQQVVDATGYRARMAEPVIQGADGQQIEFFQPARPQQPAPGSPDAPPTSGGPNPVGEMLRDRVRSTNPIVNLIRGQLGASPATPPNRQTAEQEDRINRQIIQQIQNPAPR